MAKRYFDLLHNIWRNSNGKRSCIYYDNQDDKLLLRVIPFKKVTRGKGFLPLSKAKIYCFRYLKYFTEYGVESCRGTFTCSVVCCKYTRSQSKIQNCENNHSYGKISRAELNDRDKSLLAPSTSHSVVVTVLRILKSLGRKYFKFVV